MQTTIDIDDDLLERAKDEADRRHTSIDAAVSMLIRRGLDGPLGMTISPVTGLPVLPQVPGATPVTLDMVKALMDEEDEKHFS